MLSPKPAFGTAARGQRSTQALPPFPPDGCNGPRPSKRLNDGGRDKAERGKPAYSPNQQIRHAAVFPPMSAMAPHTRDGAEGAIVKKRPPVLAGRSNQVQKKGGSS